MSYLNSDSLKPLQINAALANALDALKVAHAKQIPTAYDALLAPDGTQWHGLKADNSHWTLIRHKVDSYNVIC